LELAPRESDPVKRMALLRKAEAILMEELPVLPIYYYVSKNMFRSYVKGLHPNIQDVHPIYAVSVDKQEKEAALKSEGWR
ncbi:MAG: hypothetical protein N2C14_08560, partial [Planctomycetales bacterium]